MSELAITVIGHDRPGIIAAVTGSLSGLGLNLTDSTMTRLRGHLAMTLICTGPAGPAEVEAALATAARDGDLVATVRELVAESAPQTEGLHFLLTVHGADRLGIVAAITRTVAEAGGNITDLSTRLTGDLYLLLAEVDLPPQADPDVLRDRLAGVGRALGVEVQLRPGETDLL